MKTEMRDKLTSMKLDEIRALVGMEILLGEAGREARDSQGQNIEAEYENLETTSIASSSGPTPGSSSIGMNYVPRAKRQER